MTQYLNAHNLKYIWFKPIPFLNLRRLRETRRNNPEAKISLTISRTLLTDNEFADIYYFCKTQKIQLITIEDLEKKIDETKNKNDQKLIAIIKQELHDPHGNPAAASDILRAVVAFWIASDGSGVYLDLDTTAKIPETKWMTFENCNPYMLPVYIIKNANSTDSFVQYANDIIILTIPKKEFSDTEKTSYFSRILKDVQEKIIAHYENPLEKFLSIIPPIKNDLTGYIDAALRRRVSTTHNANNAYSIRAAIKISFESWLNEQLNASKNHVVSCTALANPTWDFSKITNKSYEDLSPTDEEESKIKQFAQKVILSFYEQFLLSKKLIEKKGTKCFGLDSREITEKEIFRKSYESKKTSLYVEFIIYTGGVYAWLDIESLKTQQQYQSFSLYHHGLGQSYIAQGGSHPGFVRQNAEDLQTRQAPDNSWLDVGKQKIEVQSKALAITVFKDHGLTVSGFKSWVEKRKKEKNRKEAHKIFKIELWKPEHASKLETSKNPNPVLFSEKNNLETPKKCITVRGENVPLPEDLKLQAFK